MKNYCFLADDKLGFFIIIWLSISQVAVQVLYKKRLSCFDPDPHYIFHILLSIPVSFSLSWFLSYGKFIIFSLLIDSILSVCIIMFIIFFLFTDIIQLYIICIGAVLSYNYLVSQLLISCHGSFTLGEVTIVAQGTILFVLYSLNSLKQV